MVFLSRGTPYAICVWGAARWLWTMDYGEFPGGTQLGLSTTPSLKSFPVAQPEHLALAVGRSASHAEVLLV